MSGVTLSDLSKYHQGAMKWFKDGLVSEHNRLFAQTGEAGAVSFWPLGGTPLEGKVKFSFKETPPASGDKGPENPSTITGVSSIGVRLLGKNLFTWTLPASNTTWGVTFSYDADGTITLNGTCDRADGVVNSSQYSRPVTPPICFGYANVRLKATVKHISGSYTLPSGADLVTQIQMSVANANGTYNYLWMNDNGADTEKTFGIASTSKITYATLKACGGVTYNNYKIKIQYEIINDFNYTDYEAPVVDPKTISLGNTYYGGSIDLKTGVMTVTHFGTVLNAMVAADAYNGSGLLFLRSWPNGYDANYISAHGLPRPKKESGIVCDRFPSSGSSDRFVIGNYNSTNQTEYLALYLNKETVGITETSLTGTEVRSKVNAYLANHPLTIVYELYTPYTVQLTPLQLTALAQKDKYTPRINTLYTDADSIQAVYRKSLIHDEDEKVQAIVALGGNV